MERVNERETKRFARMRRLFSDPSYVVTLVIAVAGAVLTFFLFSLPILKPASQIFPRLEIIWQQGEYRIALFVVMLKLCAPLLVLLFTGFCLLLWQTLRRYHEAAEQDTAGAKQPFTPPFAAPTLFLQQGRAMNSTTSGSKKQARRSPGPASLPIVAFRFRGYLGKTNSGDKKDTPSLSTRALRLKQQRLVQLRGRVKKRDRHNGREARMVSFPPPTVQYPSAPFHSTVSGERETPPTGSLVSITLLKDISLVLHASDGKDWPVLFKGAAKRTLLLAYLACKRGSPVSREKMLMEVFGHGLPAEQATPGKLSDQFDSHKKYLRADMRGEVARINELVGHEVFPPHLDILMHSQTYWTLSEDCRVVDLDEIEAQHQVIAQAKTEGALGERVPHAVLAACEKLIAAYPGDVLQSLIGDYHEVFEPWETSWVRQPFTLYRDYYLQALWYTAEYERLVGMQQVDSQALHFRRSAELYWRYAMHACSSAFDTRLSFGKDGHCHGERVVMSEYALGRCLLLYGAIGETRRIDGLFGTYGQQMQTASVEIWRPGQNLLADLKTAKECPDTYHFETHVVPDDVSDHQPVLRVKRE